MGTQYSCVSSIYSNIYFEQKLKIVKKQQLKLVIFTAVKTLYIAQACNRTRYVSLERFEMGPSIDNIGPKCFLVVDDM